MSLAHPQGFATIQQRSWKIVFWQLENSCVVVVVFKKEEPSIHSRSERRLLLVLDPSLHRQQWQSNY